MRACLPTFKTPFINFRAEGEVFSIRKICNFYWRAYRPFLGVDCILPFLICRETDAINLGDWRNLQRKLYRQHTIDCLSSYKARRVWQELRLAQFSILADLHAMVIDEMHTLSPCLHIYVTAQCLHCAFI